MIKAQGRRPAIVLDLLLFCDTDKGHSCASNSLDSSMPCTAFTKIMPRMFY
jgi:hypothetical protein